MSNVYHCALSLLSEPRHTRWVAPLLILSEVVLCYLILVYVPYTEIDYSTYIAQVHKYLQYGQKDYSKIDGPTGPLVYPAMHVWIYSILYYLTTKRDVTGEIIEINIAQAQIIFAGLYLVTLAVVVACYRRVNAPPWLLVPLVLSKRLHSIFMLRLFNDGWATLFFWLTVYTMQRRYWHLSAVVWAFGVAVKMTVLLAVPAVAVLLIQALEAVDSFYMGFASVCLQFIIASPFIEAGRGGNPIAYFTRAFDFGRQFLFKWTTNWRFVGETTFLSKEFAGGLLVLHVSLLATFMNTKWVRVSSNGVIDFVKRYTKSRSLSETQRVEKQLTPTFVMDTMLGSMFIGLLCARSLHYQFYAYIGWATPYVLWRGTGSIVMTSVVWAAQEWSWLVFPSTDVSSMVLVGALALQVVCALVSQPVDGIAPPEVAIKRMQERVDGSVKDETT